MSKKILTLLAAIALAISCHAQKYATVELAEIGNLLKKSKVQYYTRTDTAGTVTQMGCKIFSEFQRSRFPEEICDFLERYNLYFRVLKPAMREEIIRDHNIQVDLFGFMKVDSLCDFVLLEGLKMYSAIWKHDSTQVCRMDFPKEFSLIWGRNISEAQQYMYDMLTGDIPHFSPYIYNDFSRLEATPKYLVLKGSYYMIESMNHNRYFNRRDTTPLFNVFFPEESWANVMQGIVTANTPVKVVLSRYDNTELVFEVPLSRLVSFCLMDNSVAYFGVEEVSDLGLKATVIYANPKYNYNHLLSMKIDPMASKITVNVNAYIPTHNLKDLYNEKH